MTEERICLYTMHWAMYFHRYNICQKTEINRDMQCGITGSNDVCGRVYYEEAVYE